MSDAPALAFTVPWRPAVKKGSQKAVRFPRGPRCPACGTFPRAALRVVPGDDVRAEEHAIGALAVAAAALRLELVTEREWRELVELARARADRGSGVGPATLERAIGDLARFVGVVFGEDPIAVRVVELLGKRAGDDRVRVTVGAIAEPPPTARRARRPRHDLANVPAIVLDALNGVLYHDDRQVERLEAERLRD